MKPASNDDLIRAVFTATDEAKTRALAILEGRAISPRAPRMARVNDGVATRLTAERTGIQVGQASPKPAS